MPSQPSPTPVWPCTSTPCSTRTDVLHSWVALDVDVTPAGIAPVIGLEVSLLSGRCRPYEHADLHEEWQLPPELLEQEWWRAMLNVSCTEPCCLPVEHPEDGVSTGVSHAKLKYDLSAQRVVDFKVYLAVATLQRLRPRG